MADTSLEVTAGSGSNIDMRSEATNGDLRQVVVIGDPSVNAGVAPVDETTGLYVDVRACAIPTGAATAAAQTTGNASLSSIDGKITACNTGAVVVSSSALPSGAASAANQAISNASLSSLDGKVTACDTDSVIVTDCVLPTGASTLAEQQTQTASLSALDDWDESSRAKVNIIVGQAGIASGVGATGATVPRVVIANGAGRTLVSTGGSASSSGNNTLVSAGTNRLKVYAFSLTTVSTTAITCIFQDGAGGTELWRVVLQAGTGTSTGANLTIMPPAWIFATSSATLLNLNLSSANAVHWSLAYFDEA